MVFVLDSIRVQFCIWFNWFQKSVCVLKSCSNKLVSGRFSDPYSAFDEDGDGFLNLEQVYQAIHSLGKVWPMKDIREALPKDCKEVDFPGKIFPKNVDDSKVQPGPSRIWKRTVRSHRLAFMSWFWYLNFQTFWQWWLKIWHPILIARKILIRFEEFLIFMMHSIAATSHISNSGIIKLCDVFHVTQVMWCMNIRVYTRNSWTQQIDVFDNPGS